MPAQEASEEDVGMLQPQKVKRLGLSGPGQRPPTGLHQRQIVQPHLAHEAWPLDARLGKDDARIALRGLSVEHRLGGQLHLKPRAFSTPTRGTWAPLISSRVAPRLTTCAKLRARTESSPGWCPSGTWAGSARLAGEASARKGVSVHLRRCAGTKRPLSHRPRPQHHGKDHLRLVLSPSPAC